MPAAACLYPFPRSECSMVDGSRSWDSPAARSTTLCHMTTGQSSSGGTSAGRWTSMCDFLSWWRNASGWRLVPASLLIGGLLLPAAEAQATPEKPSMLYVPRRSAPIADGSAQVRFGWRETRFDPRASGKWYTLFADG